MNCVNIIFIISALTSIAFCDPNYYENNKECTLSYGSYRWEDMRINYVLPEDAVFAGQNYGGQPLFAVRGKGSNSNYYGKLPIPYPNKHAFLTNANREFETADFQILTAKAYSWCSPNFVSNYAAKIDPICRARHEGFFTPGTLVDNTCRVGWGGLAHFYNDYEILVVGAGCR